MSARRIGLAATFALLLALGSGTAWTRDNPDVERAKKELQEQLERARKEQQAKQEEARKQWEAAKQEWERKLKEGGAAWKQHIQEAKDTLKQQEGDWTVQYGEPRLTLGGLLAAPGGKGGAGGGAVEKLDPAKYPEGARPFVEKFNQALDDMKAQVYAALPTTVALSYPEPINVLIPKLRLTSNKGVPGQEKSLDCISNQQGTKFMFVGDLAVGARPVGPGAGVFGLHLAGIDGFLDPAPAGTGHGKVARTYVLGAGANGKGLAVVSVTIELDFTLQLAGKK